TKVSLRICASEAGILVVTGKMRGTDYNSGRFGVRDVVGKIGIGIIYAFGASDECEGDAVAFHTGPDDVGHSVGISRALILGYVNAERPLGQGKLRQENRHQANHDYPPAVQKLKNLHGTDKFMGAPAQPAIGQSHATNPLILMAGVSAMPRFLPRILSFLCLDSLGMSRFGGGCDSKRRGYGKTNNEWEGTAAS